MQTSINVRNVEVCCKLQYLTLSILYTELSSCSPSLVSTGRGTPAAGTNARKLAVTIPWPEPANCPKFTTPNLPVHFSLLHHPIPIPPSHLPSLSPLIQCNSLLSFFWHVLFFLCIFTFVCIPLIHDFISISNKHNLKTAQNNATQPGTPSPLPGPPQTRRALPQIALLLRPDPRRRILTIRRHRRPIHPLRPLR